MTIERLFDLGEQAAYDLQSSNAMPRQEGAPEAFAAVEKQMPGYHLANNQMVSFVRPDVPFFRGLAQRRGRPQDIAFFAALGDEFPKGSTPWFPAYMEQLTDEGGCQRFDGSFTRIDGTWRRFRQTWPQAYARHAAKQLDRVEGAMAKMAEDKIVCACGDQPDAERELEGLARLGPQDRLGKSAAALLRGLRDRSVTFKAHCTPG
ncbi:MAG TPA: hypothetical protein VMI56_06975 [Reyranella sp.]|nr:hypothetical protein [Reyranella sp.]